jgi:toxin ParE1/3/4
MAPVTNAKEFAMFETMAPKDLEELMERVRHWPEQRQQDAAEVLLEMERQDSSGYRLTDAQAREVARIQREISEGKAMLATDEQMAQAREHIAAIYSYIRDRNPVAATQVVAHIRLAAERLTEFPRMGHGGRVPGTQEWVVRGLPYILVYQIDPNEVLILGVFHAARDRERE